MWLIFPFKDGVRKNYSAVELTIQINKSCILPEKLILLIVLMLMTVATISLLA